MSCSTGKERDTESGLDYFGARYYASSMGRWMSPDWSGKPWAIPYADLRNPQSLNLYEYGANNPLSTTDKDGHCIWDGCVVEVVAAVVVVGLVAKGIHDAWKWWKKTSNDIDQTNKNYQIILDKMDTDPTAAADAAQKVQDGQVTVVKDAMATTVVTACAVPGTTCTGPLPDVPPSVPDAVNAVMGAAAGTQLPDAPTPQPSPSPQPTPTPTPTPTPIPTPQPPPPPPPPDPKDHTSLFAPWPYPESRGHFSLSVGYSV
jgi:RHS repeat-associated protein